MSIRTGNLSRDEKTPGAPLAFGNPCPEDTDAQWGAEAHLDMVSAGREINLDGEPLLRDGRFVAGME